MVVKVFSLIAMVQLVGCSVFGSSGVEELSYEVIAETDKFEIREYAGFLKAEVVVDEQGEQGRNAAFRILADYIFGKNKANKDIAMTSPVIVDNSTVSEKINMTAPVLAESGQGGTRMSFSMPSKYKTVEELPKPVDERIIVYRSTPARYAVIRFSGRLIDSNIDPMKANLLQAVNQSSRYKIKKGASVQYAGYNPPWTIPFFRRNEVLVEVVK